MRWFITGGTGLVGSHLAALLAGRGESVRVLVRETSDTAFLRGLGAEFVVGDVETSAAVLARVMDGCDIVVHAAAILYPRRAGWERYRRVNVDAVGNVLGAAALAGVSRAVHVSSIAVYGGAVAGDGLDEDDWRRGEIPERAYYPRSKREAEVRAWAYHERGDVRLTTVRPGVVYGERDRLFTRQLVRAARLPILPLPGGGRTRPPFVYAGNVAHGIVAAATRDVAIGRAYNLPADDGVTLRGLLETLGIAVGRRPRIVAVPGGAVLGAARAAGAFLHAIPGAREPQLERAARTLLHDHAYATTWARADLDWPGPVTCEDACARTADWWRARHRGTGD